MSDAVARNVGFHPAPVEIWIVHVPAVTADNREASLANSVSERMKSFVKAGSLMEETH